MISFLWKKRGTNTNSFLWNAFFLFSEKDVKRTDRSMDFFKDEESDNMKKLNDILMTYTMYNFDLGKKLLLETFKLFKTF